MGAYDRFGPETAGVESILAWAGSLRPDPFAVLEGRETRIHDALLVAWDRLLACSSAEPLRTWREAAAREAWDAAARSAASLGIRLPRADDLRTDDDWLTVPTVGYGVGRAARFAACALAVAGSPDVPLATLMTPWTEVVGVPQVGVPPRLRVDLPAPRTRQASGRSPRRRQASSRTPRGPQMKHPRLYLVRHGETDWNAAGRLLSFTDEPLNERGRAQALELGTALAKVRWTRVVSSPLIRARQTAEVLLLQAHQPPSVEIDDRLREVDFGPYEGWTEAQLGADPVAVTRRRDGAQLPGVEPDDAVVERARSFLESLEADAGATLVVGHGRMLRVLMATALGLPPSVARSLRMRHCRPAILEPGPMPLLLALNAGDPATEVVGGSSHAGP
jgi:uncharacterized phosphatase